MISVIPLKLSMSNAFLLRGEKDILVDTGSPADFPALIRLLNKNSVEVGDLALIVLTHVHFDHAGTVAALVKQAKCPVAVHRLEKENLETGRNAPIIPVHPLGKMLMPFMGARFSPTSADILIDDALDLSPYGVAAQVIFTPGHTPGSVSLLTDDHQAIVGDLCGGGWPLGQFQPSRPRYHYWASSMEDVQASLKRVLASQPSQIHVGHGGPFDGREAGQFFLGS
jgi:glyoxylase-like metal-dependent hydrolase (beta-lactamase superfamily II)